MRICILVVMSRKFKSFNILVLLVFLISIPISAKYIQEKVCYEYRYAFDFGTGTIKSRAAIVNKCNNKVVKVFGKFDKLSKFETCMQKDENGNLFLSEYCIERTKFEFERFQNDYNMRCNHEKCAGVATAWARKIHNKEAISHLLAEYGIKFEIVSQDEEGEIAFNSVLYSPELGRVDPKKLIVWDIGGGSFQFSTLDDKGKVHVYQGMHGAESFDKEVRKMYGIPASSTHPFLSHEQLDKLLEYTKVTFGEKILQDPLFYKKLTDPDVVIIAVGGPMSKALSEHMSFPEMTSKAMVKEKAQIFSGKTAKDISQHIFPKIPGFFVTSTQSSLSLIHGIMEGAQIEHIRIMHVGLTDYVLTADKYWK